MMYKCFRVEGTKIVHHTGMPYTNKTLPPPGCLVEPRRCDGIQGSHGRLPCTIEDPRPLLAFRKTQAGKSDASVGEEGEGETEAASMGSDGVMVEGEGAGGALGGGGGVGGVEELGRERCLDAKGNLVAEDVYEVLWRVMFGEI